MSVAIWFTGHECARRFVEREKSGILRDEQEHSLEVALQREATEAKDIEFDGKWSISEKKKYLRECDPKSLEIETLTSITKDKDLQPRTYAYIVNIYHQIANCFLK